MTESDAFPLPPRLAASLDDMPLEELAFTPVPVRARRDGWTPAAQQGFILRLAICGCVTRSAAGVGKTRKSAYRLRDHAGARSFAAAWDKAIGWGRDARVDHAIERAVHGEVRPYYYRGRKCGEHVRYHHGLTIAVVNLMDRRANTEDKGFFQPI